MLSPEELLAGSALTYEIEVPADVLRPGVPLNNGSSPTDNGPGKVRLRPLTVADLQIVSRAAKESDSLLATLMVQRALVEPSMTVAQVASAHAGLVEYLLDQVNRISGITASQEQIQATREAPLAKAAFVLAQEFGWTPQQVSELTLGQVLLHLRMLQEKKAS
jgi:hypothetical protein